MAWEVGGRLSSMPSIGGQVHLRATQGLKPGLWWFVNVRAEARTYLRCKCNGKSKSNRKSEIRGSLHSASLGSR
jgi:hypothetical protein